MKYSMSPSLYRYVIGLDSVLTFSSFSPARKVFSTTAPLSMFLSRVLTNAPPLPGLTCWKYRIVNLLPSTRMAIPFLNWLVDIMVGSSRSRPDLLGGPARRKPGADAAILSHSFSACQPGAALG